MMQLYCPKCKHRLVPSENGLYCKECSHLWGKKHRILSFLSNSYSYGNIPHDRWDKIFSSISGKTNEEIQSYLLSQKFKGRWAYIKTFRGNKADGLFFLPIANNDIILDIGCGPGSLSIQIAKICNKVYAVDATLNRLRFLEIRKENEALKNITPIHASALSMPFKGPCFNYILMNGVFEYMGEWGKGKNPAEIQKNTLDTAYDLLKDKGYLFIAIENRYGFDFFYKERDHSKLYLTSLLPRFIANLVTMIFNKKKYRTYTYSFSGYNKMLKEAGFKRIDFYYAWPDYRDPKYIFAQEDRNIFRYYLENFIKTASKFEYFFFKWAYKLGIEKYFVSNFIIIARK